MPVVPYLGTISLFVKQEIERSSLLSWMMTRKTIMRIFPLATFFLAMKALASEIGTCKSPLQKACESAYLGCRMSVPVDDQHGICGCASIYYGICLPAAGCAGDEIMASCISELMEWDCPDMSVCGNDCTLDDGNPQLPAETSIVPLNNFGANYLRLSVCSKDIDTAKLLRFGQVTMSNCWDEDFRVCNLWVAPRTLTSVAIPADVTRLRVEQCARLVGAENDAGSEDWECLGDPRPVEYYGTTVVHGSGKGTNGAVTYWPSVLNVAYSTAALCEKDSHCPGSFCDSQYRPRKCAPKLEEHFVESGSHYLQARWQILQHMSKGR